MASVPDDFLLLIFEAMSGPVMLSWPRAEYDHKRAVAPFALAAVSRRWRALARTTPTIWAYFGFPAKFALRASHLARLKVLVSLVKHHKIDVLFGCDATMTRPYITNIYNTLTQLVFQWRSANLILDSTRNPFPADLTSPTKELYLEQLTISGTLQQLRLPSAPFMKKLHLQCNFADSQPAPAAPTPLPSLRYFACLLEKHTEIELLCGSYALQLTELCILFPMRGRTFGPIHCPNVTTLILEDSRYLECIHAPNLQSLSISTGNLSGFDTAEFPNVSHLTLFGDVGHGAVDMLQNLRSIVRLSLATPDAVNVNGGGYPTTYSVTEGFFDQLATRRPPIWPALESIHLGYFGKGPPFRSLFNFVESRNALAAGEDKHAEVNWDRPSVLKNVVLSPELKITMPRWARIRLAHILKAAHTIC
ncbi:hypothetical protein BKA62DRAFT_719326 [Auriculariales sp. MPI-PUGE-AT-0066]|nr:hypothetical protein BKA62DRAFT_719326 [Auriculariales sp. MPI-PUGE-AT-0066]